MLQTEFVRSLHCNYERILLDKKPEERKYQYCILSRGGIKGLLPFSLRYMNGLAYLYYDITSKQNVAQLFEERCITAEWLKDFMWSMKQVRMELERFLLDEKNILWYPEQIFQDLEKNLFSFLYIPYYEGEGSFMKLLEYLVEHIDYEDDRLVDCVYRMHEQYEKNGDTYLQEQVFKDVKDYLQERDAEENTLLSIKQARDAIKEQIVQESEPEPMTKPEKKGLLSFWDSRRKKDRELRVAYEQNVQQALLGYAVAEESTYEPEDYGNTICIEEKKEDNERIPMIYSSEGKLLAQMEAASLTIGKRRGEVQLCLEDMSVSRLHAKLIREGEDVYIEDLNSTNGTYKNGLRLKPYEKRKLEIGDEIKCGRRILIFR
ncbi:MAG: FHA domain-containing protein [Lachnospiraceae bacterium]|nr:FHA domain-containing protein [Lachnospiraceae bacterium]